MESEWAVINAAIVDTQVLLLMAVETDEKKNVAQERVTSYLCKI